MIGWALPPSVHFCWTAGGESPTSPVCPVPSTRSVGAPPSAARPRCTRVGATDGAALGRGRRRGGWTATGCADGGPPPVNGKAYQRWRGARLRYEPPVPADVHSGPGFVERSRASVPLRGSQWAACMPRGIQSRHTPLDGKAYQRWRGARLRYEPPVPADVHSGPGFVERSRANVPLRGSHWPTRAACVPREIKSRHQRTAPSHEPRVVDRTEEQEDVWGPAV